MAASHGLLKPEVVFPDSEGSLLAPTSTFHSTYKIKHITLETGLEKEQEAKGRVMLCLSSVSLVLTLWHQNSGKAGRWHSSCREEEAGRGRIHRCSVLTLPEKSGKKIESDLIPWGTGEQRLPFLTEGLPANSAGDMGSEPFSLVVRKT